MDGTLYNHNYGIYQKNNLFRKVIPTPRKYSPISNYIERKILCAVICLSPSKGWSNLGLFGRSCRGVMPRCLTEYNLPWHFSVHCSHLMWVEYINYVLQPIYWRDYTELLYWLKIIDEFEDWSLNCKWEHADRMINVSFIIMMMTCLLTLKLSSVMTWIQTGNSLNFNSIYYYTVWFYCQSESVRNRSNFLTVWQIVGIDLSQRCDYT